MQTFNYFNTVQQRDEPEEDSILSRSESCKVSFVFIDLYTLFLTIYKVYTLPL
jgi:hypothetical protein